MNCQITSCKGIENCLQHCPCRCHLKDKVDWRTDKQDEAVRNLFRDYLRNVIRAEIWRYHELTDSFLKHHSIEQKSELALAINELCVKSHNEVLEDIIKKHL